MFFALENLSSQALKPVTPWNLPLHIPEDVYAGGKTTYRDWCTLPETKHCFYNAVEGVHPGMRVTKENPARFLHGFVADFDAPVTPEMMERLCDPSVFPRFRPNYACRTFSGYARLIWTFESAVMTLNNDVAASFFQTLVKRVKAETMLPGFDAASCDAHQYFELGYDWMLLEEEPLPEEHLWAWMAQAGRRSNLWFTEDIPIPLELVQKEIEIRWPGVWQGPFETGRRCRRFWDAHSSNPTAAILRDTGFQCFTGDKPFVSWRDLFGSAFMENHEADRIGRAIQATFYDGTSFWFKDAEHRWVNECTANYQRLLRTEYGLEGRLPKGQTYSEVDRALCDIQKMRRVDAALPMLYRPTGLMQHGAKRVLNISQITVVPPADAAQEWGTNFPWLAGFLDTCMKEPDALPYLLAWWQRFYKGGLEQQPQPGQAIFFAGEVGCGKTLLNQRIIGRSAGGFVDARSYIVEASAFSGSYLEYPVMSIDDSTVNSDFKKHQRYSSLIKALTANPEVEYHQKYRASAQISWMGRVVISLNDDAQSMQMLPDLEQSLEDKIMVFRMQAHHGAFPDRYVLEYNIDQELPYFLRWLLDWNPPEHVLGDHRFGVRAYHDKQLRRASLESGTAYQFLDLLMLFLEDWKVEHRQEEFWEGSVAELVSGMRMNPRTEAVIRDYKASHIGILLTRLQAQGLDVIRHDRTARRFGYRWKINANLDKGDV